MLTWNFYLRRILPVGLFMALTLLCGNLVYLYLTVSFIQMLKARPYTPACWQMSAFGRMQRASVQNAILAQLAAPIPVAHSLADGSGMGSTYMMLGGMQACRG